MGGGGMWLSDRSVHLPRVDTENATIVYLLGRCGRRFLSTIRRPYRVKRKNILRRASRLRGRRPRLSNGATGPHYYTYALQMRFT